MNAGDGPSDELMDARDDALATIFGPEDETRIVSPIPYFLGGDPTILTFSKHLPGTIYCTSEMTGGWGSGQRPGPLGEYELAIVLKSGSRLGPQPTGHDHVLTKGWSGVLLSGYAKYSCEHVLKHGDTGGPLPPEFEPLRHILFVEIGDGKLAFEFLRKRYGLLLMVLITESEFEFKQKEGTDALLRCLRAAKIFPFSDPERTSVV